MAERMNELAMHRRIYGRSQRNRQDARGAIQTRLQLRNELSEERATHRTHITEDRPIDRSSDRTSQWSTYALMHFGTHSFVYLADG